jgi:hypothetical protein
MKRLLGNALWKLKKLGLFAMSVNYSYQLELERQFIQSIKHGATEKVIEFLRETNYPFASIKDVLGDRPLHIAASYGHNDIIMALVQHVNYPNGLLSNNKTRAMPT